VISCKASIGLIYLPLVENSGFRADTVNGTSKIYKILIQQYYIYIYIYIWLFACLCMCLYMCLCEFVCVCVCVCEGMCMCVCASVSSCMYPRGLK